MRILHFSDIHIGIKLREVPLARWLSKRALGGINLLLGRHRCFLDARRKVAALARFNEEQRTDLVICTGDYTAMGLEREFRDARSAVEPLMGAPLGFVNMPGNHDLYVRDVIRQGRFEQHFGDTLETDLPQHRADGPWPLIRLYDEAAVIVVNSSRPNPPWRSNGHVPRKQLAAVKEALQDPLLNDRFVFVATHYAPCLADGTPDRRLHGLVNADDFLAVCNGTRRGAILCGHVHRCYHARPPRSHLPVFCAGTATMDGHEGLWFYELDGTRLRATPGRWEQERYRLDAASAIEV